TAIYLVACLAPLGLLLLGPDCSSWTLVSRGSSWRSVMNPNGRLGLDWIRNSNLMISRCTLILHLCLAVCAIYVMEQPRGSEEVLPRHKRFEAFCNLISFAA
ncbi:unnamed protein product, partial [Cladocopium goreaui]